MLHIVSFGCAFSKHSLVWNIFCKCTHMELLALFEGHCLGVSCTQYGGCSLSPLMMQVALVSQG